MAQTQRARGECERGVTSGSVPHPRLRQVMALSTTGPWPDGATCAVSLTFDDGMQSQLKLAFPLLEKYGLKATFYLFPRRERWRERLEPWRKVHQAGHEIGNHTASHICSRQMTGAPKGKDNLEGLTLEEIEADILLAEERIAAVMGSEPRSFCYPCYQCHVGEGAERKSYVPVVARHFLAGRGTGEFGSNHPASCDLHYLWSWRCEQLTGAHMVGFAEEGTAKGTWEIFVFHGIDDGPLNTAARHLERLLVYLDRNRDRIWTAPVRDVATRIRDWRRTTG